MRNPSAFDIVPISPTFWASWDVSRPRILPTLQETCEDLLIYSQLPNPKTLVWGNRFLWPVKLPCELHSAPNIYFRLPLIELTRVYLVLSTFFAQKIMFSLASSLAISSSSSSLLPAHDSCSAVSVQVYYDKSMARLAKSDSLGGGEFELSTIPWD